MFLTIGNTSTILIRISSKCSSNCLTCALPHVQENKFYNLDKLNILLEKINVLFSPSYEIGFLGYNLLKIDSIYSLVSNFPSRVFVFQIGLTDVFNYKIIKKKQQEFGNIYFGIQETINTNLDFKNVFNVVKFCIENDMKVSFNILIDFSKYDKILKFLKLKYKYKFFKGFYRFFIGNIFIDFEDCSFMSSINKLGLESCVSMQNFYLSKGNVYIKDDLEIMLNGDIKFHLNQYCNKGILKISNIYNSHDKIYSNFQHLGSILNDYGYIPNENRCVYCLKNPIKF